MLCCFQIADFGLSNVFKETSLLSTFCGSPLYASPEIVKGTPYIGPEVRNNLSIYLHNELGVNDLFEGHICVICFLPNYEEVKRKGY